MSRKRVVKVIEDWKPFRRIMSKKRKELLEKIKLGQGEHSRYLESPDTLCVMESLAYITGQGIIDHPVCVSRAITSYLIDVNDDAGFEERQKLKELIPLILHTAPVQRRVVQVVGGKVVTEERALKTDEYTKAERERYNTLEALIDEDDLSVETALKIVPKLVKMGKF